MRFRSSCFAAAFCSTLLLSGCAHVPAVDAGALLARHVPQDYTGVAALRTNARSTMAVRATGLAAREAASNNTPGTRFLVGSATKWMTAVAVLRLVDLGKLDLDAPIARHLPELPPANGAVTLRQLLANHSGIPNGLSAAMRADPAIGKLTIGPVAAALRFGAGALDARPGEKWDYSITNWLLVAAVVERANGKPYTDTVTELVFAPAKVGDTGFATDGYADTAGTAVAYDQANARKTPTVPPMVAAGGIVYSTARDLVAIADTVYFTKLLSDQSRAELSTIQVADQAYALGGRVKTISTQRGERTLAWESGAIGGYKTLLAYDQHDGAAVVLLNNTDMQQSRQAQIANALFEAL
jgi:D-alanyl-D-alanine carboxypeptidase